MNTKLVLQTLRPIARDYKEMLETRRTILGDISYRRRIDYLKANSED